eukprot:416324-Prymnesium_polylepis.4
MGISMRVASSSSRRHHLPHKRHPHACQPHAYRSVTGGSHWSAHGCGIRTEKNALGCQQYDRLRFMNAFCYQVAQI